MTLSRSYNLKVLYPELAKQWHPVKNGDLTPGKITPGTNRKVWWKCCKGHEWQAVVHDRSKRGDGCPYCNGKRASKEYNLLALRPELAKQWHPIKNSNLTPDKVTPGSNKKVWWKCDKGHDWQSSISHRNIGYGCPYCSGKRASKEYNLSVIRPELAKQWHPVKNGDLTPDKVTPGSNKKIWWKCDKGHDWKSAISHRNIGTGCPYCCGKRASKEYNLLALRPEIAKQWHPVKNGNLTPDKVTPGSGKKVWWKCNNGHEWQCSINERNISGCPYCSGKRASKEYNLSVLRPEIAKQWHPFKNGSLTPDKVTPGSLKKVWWKCNNGHEWQANIIHRKKNLGCPCCSGRRASKEYNLLALQQKIARWWHPTKNGNLTPDKVTPGSGRKVWWMCEKGHEWRAVIVNKREKQNKKFSHNCPFCAGKKPSKDYNLLAVRPEIAKQWHPVKNGKLTPDKVTPSAHNRVWWICDKGHEWQNTIAKRKAGTGCPKCASKTATKEHNLMNTHPDISGQWDPTKNGFLTPEDVTPHSRKKVWWICHKGHEWEDLIRARTKYGNTCPYCDGTEGFREYNLSALHPDIARQWHPTKNGHLTPGDVAPGSNKKVWWRCKKGHEWETKVNYRLRNLGCPYCFLRRPSREYNLLKIYPEIAKQWHPTKNGNLTPDKITHGSRKRLWWKCNNGHEWRSLVAYRSGGSGCPYCFRKHKKNTKKKILIFENL